MTEIRYRVVCRAYVKFADGTKVEKGKLIQKEIRVEDWLVDVGWVDEDI